MTARELQVLYLVTFIIGLGISTILYAFMHMNLFLVLIFAFILSSLLFLIIGIPMHIIIAKRRGKKAQS